MKSVYKEKKLTDVIDVNPEAYQGRAQTSKVQNFPRIITIAAKLN